jgi:hypothetical protein
MTGSEAGNRQRHSADFYICPSCGTLTIYSATRDANGRPLYDCAKYRHQFDEETLEQHRLERHSTD